MKLNIPTLYVPYGPVGHPKARFMMEHASFDQDRIPDKVRVVLYRSRIMSEQPGMFFDPDLTLEEQGYYLLPVNNGEVSDELVASLAPAPVFTPAPAGAPGRKLADFAHLLPDYLIPQPTAYAEGDPHCDHDFAPETWTVLYQTVTGRILSEEDALTERGDGAFLHTVSCTRCGHKLAFKE